MKGSSDANREDARRFVLLAAGSRTRPRLRERLCHFLTGKIDPPHVPKEARAHCLMHTGVRRVGQAYMRHLVSDGRGPAWWAPFRQGAVGVARSGLALLIALGGFQGQNSLREC